MNRRETRHFVNRQITEIKHLRSLVSGHALMEPLLAQHEDELRKEAQALPVDISEARTILFFTGKPVYGSSAIDAHFVSSVLNPFLEMVKSQYAASKHGQVGERGPRRDEDEARLMLTGTPRGSFGLELSHPFSDDLFAEERLTAILVQLTRLIEATGESDEGFLLNLDEISPRAFIHLLDFFKVLRNNEANLRMQTGDIEFELSQNRIQKAYERVNTSKTLEQKRSESGIFRGATLDTWRFDFRKDNGENISGKISGELSEDSVAAMLAFANRRCLADLNEITVITSGGAMRRRFILLGLDVDIPTSMKAEQ